LNNMWIASQPRAFISTALFGLVAGFFLGVHAVTGSNAAGASMICAAVLGAIVGFAAGRRMPPAASPFPPAASPPPPAASPAPAPAHSLSPSIEDAEAALASLGYSAREARSAVASALATLDDDADAAAIVKAALRARR
jgi:RuvA, C-terminal domain